MYGLSGLYRDGWQLPNLKTKELWENIIMNTTWYVWTYVTEVQNAVRTAQYRMRDLTVIFYAVYGM
jgi:hypothetical protein